LSLSLMFLHQNPVHASPLPIRATCLAHLILDVIIRTTVGKEYRSWCSSLWSFLRTAVTSSLLGPNTLPNITILKKKCYCITTMRYPFQVQVSRYLSSVSSMYTDIYLYHCVRRDLVL
jgi:hypothetical protein